MNSLEHKKYLKNIKKHKFKITIYQIAILILFIFSWQVLANLKLINTFIYSSPLDILKTLINLATTNNLIYHIYITLLEVIISFILCSLIGLLVASIMWSNKTLAKVLEPYLTIINSLPKVALGPIIIIWFGANNKSIIVLSLLISVFITIINLHSGFINIDSNKLKLFKVLKATKLQTYFKLVIPNSYLVIINCMKVNISMSLIGVIMGEFLVSKAGIGYLIMYGSNVFNLDLVITGVFILGVISTILYLLIALIERRLLRK